MNSGNTYRMRPDGSHVEYFTHGQVNPFGLASTRWATSTRATATAGRSTSSSAGPSIPSFGKPHDGLGFGPEMITHDHGSTGIAGIAYYAADQFPDGLPRHDLHRQRGDQPDQPRPARVARLDAQGRSSSPTSSGATTPGSARWTSSSAPTGRCTSPTSTTGSSATTRCR